MENQLYDLENWSEELHIKFDLVYKWTGIIKLKDGYVANLQSDTLNGLIENLWQASYDRRIRNSWPENIKKYF